jgi:hydrogenase expression/formation protein HypC
LDENEEKHMCLGIPGQVVEIVDAANCLAKVDVSGVQRTISIRLLEREGVRPQDWVLVHVGFAMARIDEAEALATLAAVRQMGEAYQSEIEAFDSSSIV